MKTPSLVRKLDNEGGFALASVVFLGAVMIILASIIVLRASARVSLETASNNSDEALLVAEGSLDAYVASLATTADPDAVSTGQTLAELSDKSGNVDKNKVRDAALALAAKSAKNVIQAPEGEAVIVKPSDGGVVFSVGFVPGVSTTAKVRVLRIDYAGASGGGATTWTASQAVLTGSGFDLGRSALVTGSILVGANFADMQRDSTINGDIHANGSYSEDSNVTVSGCVTASSGTVTPKKGCATSPTTTQTIPVVQIDARSLHYLSWYDLCPKGVRKYGPAHPTAPAALKGSADVPCSGQVASDSSPWVGSGTTWSVSHSNKITGVFYVYGGDVDFDRDVTGTGATIIVEKDYGSASTSPDPLPACGTGTGGNIMVGRSFDDVAAATTILPSESIGIALVAEGTINIDRDVTITGLVVSREEVVVGRSFDMVGALAGLDACSRGSSVDRDATIALTGTITTPFSGPGGGSTSSFSVSSRDEV
jgi:hypothetical protein